MNNVKWKVHHGFTLIEVLASLLLISIIAVVSYSIFFGGLKAYERTMEQSKLRDEADYIMANVIETIYTLKMGEIEEIFLPEAGTNNYYFKKKTGEIIGFINGKVIVNNKEISLNSGDIILADESKIEETDGGKYRITLVLQSKTANEKLALETVFSIINDTKEGEN